MVDTLSPERRSWLMSRVAAKNTKPELIVRRALTALGYRYRLHRTDLPGKPDIVFPSMRKAIFVHGCFWHRHANCSGASTPKSNVVFWRTKFESNVERDKRNVRALRRNGWSVLIVWQCQTRNPERLTRRLERFLERQAR